MKRFLMLTMVLLKAHAGEPYLRLVDGRGGDRVLEIASQSFRFPDREAPVVTLLGVAHIGMASFYEEIQRRLNAADLVLFEGVGGDDPMFRHADPEGPLAEGMQARLARATGLEFQLFALDYSPEHFVNSDLSVGELLGLFGAGEEGGEGRMLQTMAMLEGSGLSGQVMLALLSTMELRPALSRGFRWALVEILGNVPANLSEAPGVPEDIRELMEVLLDRRNDRVLEDVARVLKRKHPPREILIFYGAAHMADLEDRLVAQHGLIPAGDREWLPAMRGNLNRSGLSAVEKGILRNFVRQQVRTMQRMTAMPEVRDPAAE